MATVTNAAKKRQIIDGALAQIKKAMPDEILGRYSTIGDDIDVETISTGSLAVDEAIGGGFAKTRIINIVGHTSSGKTTLALTCAATLQKEDKSANILYCDAEQTLDPSYAESLGVNVDDMIIMQPSSGEAGFKAIEMFINSGVADLVVVDSVAAMLPKAIIERDYDQENQPGVFSKLISTAIGRINRLLKKNNCTVILINQWKPVVKMNQFAAVPGAMGNWYQPGGAQLPFYCSQIIEVKKSGEVKVGKEVKSSVTTMTCKKNKIAPPYRTADFVITYGQGLDKIQELIGLGHSLGMITFAGAWCSMPDIAEGRWNGRPKFGEFLKENPDVCSKLEAAIKERIKGQRSISYKKEEDPDLLPDPIDDDNYDYGVSEEELQDQQAPKTTDEE